MNVRPNAAYHSDSLGNWFSTTIWIFFISTNKYIILISNERLPIKITNPKSIVNPVIKTKIHIAKLPTMKLTVRIIKKFTNLFVTLTSPVTYKAVTTKKTESVPIKAIGTAPSVIEPKM